MRMSGIFGDILAIIISIILITLIMLTIAWFVDNDAVRAWHPSLMRPCVSCDSKDLSYHVRDDKIGIKCDKCGSLYGWEDSPFNIRRWWNYRMNKNNQENEKTKKLSKKVDLLRQYDGKKVN